jgi:cellulose synthase/poly-beta-1,6-N-acetylglucosamine synthase-like glycosyltransferase
MSQFFLFYVLSLLLLSVGYGLGYLWIFRRGRGSDTEQVRVQVQSASERVNIVIPVRDEVNMLRAKLLNLRSQTYPIELLDVIVVDSSHDDSIAGVVKEFCEMYPNLHLVRIKDETGRGKYYSLNLGFRHCMDSFIILSDVDVLADSTAVQELIRNFRCANIGAVSAMETTKSEFGELSAYRGLYNMLRLGESRLGAVLMCESNLAAYRRELVGELPENVQCDDLALTAAVLSKGYQAIYDPRVLFIENQEGLTRIRMMSQKLRRARANIHALMTVVRQTADYPQVFRTIVLPFELFIHIVAPVLFCICVVSLALIGIFDGVISLALAAVVPLILAVGLGALLSMKTVPSQSTTNAIQTSLNILYAFGEYNIALMIGLILAVFRGPQTKWDSPLVRSKS